LQHPEANGYTVAVEAPSIVWDKLVLYVNVDSSSLGASKVKVTIAYAYDGASVTDATVAVNGKLCEDVESGIYETLTVSWSPYEQLTVTADAAGLPEETLTISTFHAMNTLLYLALAIAAIVIALFLLRRLRRSPNQTIEQLK
jgi:hypothetical protein